jgi:hypothetical protein
MLDADRAQQQRDRVGAIAHADRMRGSRCRSKLGFERLDFRPEDEPSAGDDALDGGAHRRVILTRPQVDEWD